MAKVLDKSGKLLKKYVCSECDTELDNDNVKKCPKCGVIFEKSVYKEEAKKTEPKEPVENRPPGKKWFNYCPKCKKGIRPNINTTHLFILAVVWIFIFFLTWPMLAIITATSFVMILLSTARCPTCKNLLSEMASPKQKRMTRIIVGASIVAILVITLFNLYLIMSVPADTSEICEDDSDCVLSKYLGCVNRSWYVDIVKGSHFTQDSKICACKNRKCTAQIS